MARNPIRARRKKMGIAITPQKGCYINYMLRVRGITQETVATKAGVTQHMVSQVLCGVKNSEKVKNALAEILGYESFDTLLAFVFGKEAV